MVLSYKSEISKVQINLVLLNTYIGVFRNKSKKPNKHILESFYSKEDIENLNKRFENYKNDKYRISVQRAVRRILNVSFIEGKKFDLNRVSSLLNTEKEWIKNLIQMNIPRESKIRLLCDKYCLGIKTDEFEHFEVGYPFKPKQYRLASVIKEFMISFKSEERAINYFESNIESHFDLQYEAYVNGDADIREMADVVNDVTRLLWDGYLIGYGKVDVKYKPSEQGRSDLQKEIKKIFKILKVSFEKKKILF